MPMPEAIQSVLRDLLDPQLIARGIETILVLILIALAAWVTRRVSLAIIRRAGARAPGLPRRTLVPLLEGLVRYTILVAAFVLMLQAVHVNVTALLAGAGLVGVALGFGAQFLIRDLVAGFFLLTEAPVDVGDLVRIDGDLGTVERITLRFTQIRKYTGELLTIHNGAITKIGNLSRGYGRAVVQVTVPYRTDVSRALQILREVGETWAAARTQDAQGPPSLDGVVDLRDTGAVVQLSVRVHPGAQAGVEAELRQRALEAFAAQGIVIETPGVVSPERREFPAS